MELFSIIVIVLLVSIPNGFGLYEIYRVHNIDYNKEYAYNNEYNKNKNIFRTGN